MKKVLPFVIISALLCISATMANAQGITSPHNQVGEIEQLKKPDVCGPYFQEGGAYVLFTIKDRKIEGELVRATFVVSKRNIIVVVDDAQKVPYAWFSFNPLNNRPLITIKASALDVQRAKCLGVINND